MNEAFVVCHNLVKIYKVADLEVVALQGLDLVVAEGEMVGMVGASGSGKTTLLNILGGLDRPSAGQVSVGGRSLLQLSPGDLDLYRRRHVGFLWQQTGRNLIPYLSAQQNVRLPMLLSGIAGSEARAWAEELLRATGLWQQRNSRLAQLSGGQQQRVAVAVALANRPQLLLADEPTGELDSETAREVLALLRTVNGRYGVTMVLVTHDPQIAGAVDRVLTLSDGRASSEKVRRAAEVEAAMAQAPADAVYDEFTVVDEGGRLQLPPHLVQELSLGRRVCVERVDGGIMIRPAAEGSGDGKREPGEVRE